MANTHTYFTVPVTTHAAIVHVCATDDGNSIVDDEHFGVDVALVGMRSITDIPLGSQACEQNQLARHNYTSPGCDFVEHRANSFALKKHDGTHSRIAGEISLRQLGDENDDLKGWI